MVKQPESEKRKAFAEYIFNSYISTSAPFQPPAWTNQEVEGRTNNACEAFHKNFKQSFISSKPNIFLFMQNLAHEISKATLKMKTPVATKRKADRDIEKNRLELINMYKKGHLTTERFLKKISYNLLPVLDLRYVTIQFFNIQLTFITFYHIKMTPTIIRIRPLAVPSLHVKCRGGLVSSVGSGFAPWPRGRGFETQPSTVRAPTGWVGVSIM
ncbi:UDP-N-acetylglucosamine--N-acetylmuramyl-(Pentapeptide) pyrophosphoryl-undecaprenol N-acetylglucosamine transferase [Elysia marginata]|uniref:UDP-N-acetylglucosamine--N-acetylmuramyl-(Pentapeptide) pyrophosphoryl-undecaprenol N-acetylglucosamine transferase n=1 Tax=Elysia marginata TaxID=1093978 RepID=A0AAV4HFW6_9GAST|nr:UDP-N-acetylglucosamine--N-acetylmuramyl-(Pentapeptide) pyrophosphoryl-undecaprenol N-acetylglucosamine transferase [Elysia marginata]